MSISISTLQAKNFALTQSSNGRCILAEMFTGKVFIMGKSNSHQLLRIFYLIGPPKHGAWERFDSILQYNDVQEDDPSFTRKSIKVQEIVQQAHQGYNNTDTANWNL